MKLGMLVAEKSLQRVGTQINFCSVRGLCGCLHSNWCPHPKPSCPMSYVDWKYLSNNFPVLYELSGLALDGTYLHGRREEKGEKDNDSSAVPDKRKFVDLICAAQSFKRLLFINS